MAGPIAGELAASLLSPAGAIDLLIQKNLLRKQHVVNGDVTIERVPRRNHNLLIMVRNRDPFLLKQARDRDRPHNIANEARALGYLALAGDRGTRQLSCGIPNLHLHDRARGLLVTGVRGQTEPFAITLARSRKFAPAMFTRLGRLLAELHRLRPLPAKAKFENWTPQATILSDPPLEGLSHYSHGCLELIGVFQKHNRFAAALQTVCANSKVECLVHGDIKFDNLLRVRGGGAPSMLCITDWEHFAVGDRAWDVGSVFADALCWWVFSMPISQDTPSHEALTLLRHPLTSIGTSVRGFWSSYFARSDLDKCDHQDVLVRAMEMAAVRVVQTAFEAMMQRSRLTSNVVCLLQLSQNIIADPPAALRDLFGLEQRA